MPNQQHVDILKQGAEAWQRWRHEHAGVNVDLHAAHLEGADLRGVDLSGLNLRTAVLRGTNLTGAQLQGANFEYAEMAGVLAQGANFSQSKLQCAVLVAADLTGANLAKANLRVAKLTLAKLRGAELSGADLSYADLRRAELRGADLRGASLYQVELHGADLREVQTDEWAQGVCRSFMADPEHLALLRLGAQAWNDWRGTHPQAVPRLQYTDLADANLQGANLRGAQLLGADLRRANLSHANLAGADLADARLDDAYLFLADLSGAELRRITATNARLVGTNLKRACLAQADFSRAALLPHVQEDRDDAPSRGCDLSEADLSGAELDSADLSGAILIDANLSAARLCDAKLAGADLSFANLKEAVLQRANLAGANLSDANLQAARLNGANLTGADLSHAVLVETDFTDAVITAARVYGVAAWNVGLANAAQHDLVISKRGDPVVTVDDLEVAQFIYLMLNNSKIRNVIDSITAKGVLILGRFADPQRKAVLDGLRHKLREFDLLPMVFDFDRPTDKDYTETVQTLAGLSMFVIVDVTSPKSTPLELEATVKQFKIPYLPIIDVSVDPRPFAMLVDSQKSFHWVMDTLGYSSKEELLDDANLKEYIIDRATAKREELRTAKNAEPPMLLIRRKPGSAAAG